MENSYFENDELVEEMVHEVVIEYDGDKVEDEGELLCTNDIFN